MEKWVKMSERQPQINGWDIQCYMGINKYGVLVYFTGMADENSEGEVTEHWSYVHGHDCVDFEDIVYWLELIKH